MDLFDEDVESLKKVITSYRFNDEETLAGIKEIEQTYQQAVLRLPEKQRAVFLMSREDGLSQKQIAESHKISVNTVNNHIKAALKNIRKDMGHFSEALPLITILSLYV